MKKSVITIVMLSGFLTMYSCKQKKKQEDAANQTTTSQPATDAKQESTSAAEPKTYVVSALPDTALLGKNKEALIKIKDLKAIELSNPDGHVTGIELSYKIELTNKNAIGGSSVGVATTDFRLVLDNGNKIAPNSTYVSAEPEATKLSAEDKFTLPAGAKPTALNLFFDQTRAVIQLELK